MTTALTQSSLLDAFQLFLSTTPMTEGPFRDIKKHPCLRRFPEHDGDIRFNSLLGMGKEGVVFSITVNGCEYALKVFQPFEPSPDLRPLPDTIRWACFTSFGRECRAFARLIDINESGTFAVKCHGWIRLSTEQLTMIRNRFRIFDLTEWALVKDRVDLTAREEQIPVMIDNWDIPAKAMMLVDDVRSDNYGDGKFLDLGQTTCFPYPRPYWPGHLLEVSIIDYKRLVGAWKVHEGRFMDS